MIPNTRTCMVFKHDIFPCSHICTHQDCNFDYRWVCGECIKNQLHQHGQNTQSHLLGQDDFKSYFKQIDLQQLLEQENRINQYLGAIYKIREQINQLDQYLQHCLKEAGNKTTKNLQNLIDNNFFMIDNQQICQIVKLNQNPNLIFNQNKVDEIMNEVILQSKQLMQVNDKPEQIVTYQNFVNSQPQFNKRIKFSQQQPILQVQQVQQDQQILQVQQVQQIQQVKQLVQQQPLFTQVEKKPQTKLTYEVYKKFQQNQYIYAAQISQNEKHLVFGGEEKKIIIYNLQQQNSKEMKFDHSIEACCFSRDSTLLYIGCENGYFHCIQFQTNLSHRYKEQLHKDVIMNIYQLENDQVISGSQKNIIIADIKEQKKLYKLDAPEGLYFSGLAIKYLNIIVTGLSDGSINFYNQKLIQLFRVQDVTRNPIHSIRFLGDDQIIILDNSGTLKLCEIDFSQKTSKILREIKDKGSIYNFGVSQIKNQIIIICKKYFVVFDNYFSNQQTIEHTQGIDVMNRVEQLQSMNYVIIQGSNKITIMKSTEGI